MLNGNHSTYRVLLIIFLRVDIQTRRPSSSHSLIPIPPSKKPILLFAVMHTLNNFRANQRTLGNDTLERNHPIQVNRSQCAWITGQFSKSPNISAIVVLDVVRIAITYLLEYEIVVPHLQRLRSLTALP